MMQLAKAQRQTLNMLETQWPMKLREVTARQRGGKPKHLASIDGIALASGCGDIAWHWECGPGEILQKLEVPFY